MSELEQIIEDTLKDTDKRTLMDKIKWNAPSYCLATTASALTYVVWDSAFKHFAGHSEPKVAATGAVVSALTLYYYKEWLEEIRFNRKAKEYTGLRQSPKKQPLTQRIKEVLRESIRPHAVTAHAMLLPILARQPFIRILGNLPLNLYKSIFGCSELITGDQMHLPASFPILRETIEQIPTAHRQYHIAETVYAALTLAGYAAFHRWLKRMTPIITDSGKRRYMWNIAPKVLYYHLRKDNNSLEKILTDNLDVDPYAVLTLTQHYVEAGRLDNAFETIGKIRKPKEMLRLGIGDFTKTNMLKILSLLEKNPDSPLLHTYLGQYALMSEGLVFAKECFSRSASCNRQRNQRAGDYSLIYSLFLQSTEPESHETQDHWSQTIDMIVNDPDSAKEQIGETSHRVYSKGSRFIKNTLVFKEYESIDSIALSFEATERKRRLVKDCPHFDTYENITSFRNNDSAIAVMRYSEGRTLWQKIQAGEEVYADIEEIVEFLAHIHSGMPRDQRPVSTQDRIAQALSSPNLHLPEHLKQKILDNYAPILHSLDSAIPVYNNDAHPENWMLHEDMIISLDNDLKGLVAQQLDLVNLFEYGQYLTGEQKISLMRKYISVYNAKAEDRIKDEESFIIGYHNAVVHRALALSSAWSSPERQSMHPHRESLVANALNSLASLRQDHAAAYNAYQTQYSHVEEALHEYRSYVSPESC